jgi:PAS domain S-box-containing protein
MPDVPRPQGGWHLSISRKVILLFAALALAGAGSGLVVHRAISQLDGVATEINLYGSLRYLGQKIQVVLHDVAHGEAKAGEVEGLIGEFETNLMQLQQSTAGVEAGDEVRRMLAAVIAEWTEYRAALRRFLQAPPAPVEHAAALRRLSVRADSLLAEANRATWTLSGSVTQLQEQARGQILRLALLDAALLVFAYAYIRRRMVLPLRDLAGVTLRFAGGDHDARSGFRSHDEIGRLAEAFDHMADETERHIGVIAADLEDIRRKESELRKLSQAIEHSPVAVIITDAEARIEYINPRTTEVTGYSADEVRGRKTSLFQSGQTLPETYRSLWQAIRSGKVWRGELLNRKKNGELFWELAQISPIRDATGQIAHFVAVKEDITAQRSAEQALMMMNIELERRVSERTRQIESANRDLRSFNHSISHDLRTPLRAIHGFANAIEDEGGSALKGELRDYLQRIQAAAVRMGELIDDLLELGRVGQMEVVTVPVNLSRMAREILAGLAAAEPGRHVETAVEEGIVVQGDSRLLRIALESLLGNAWKFTAENNKARIVFGHASRNDRTMLMVSDNGAGFNMAYADKLFRPFQRLHAIDRFPGAGIGLAIVKRIFELHGGNIEAEGVVGKGAAFYFELPDAPAAECGDLAPPTECAASP